MEESPSNLEQNLLLQPSQEANSETDTSDLSSSQLESDFSQPKPEPNSSNMMRSTVQCSFYARKDTEARGLHSGILRSQKIFPLFENTELAKLSVNYFLYFEFYHMAIRMLTGTLLISLAGYIAYFIGICLAPEGYESEIQPMLAFFFIGFTSTLIIITRYLEINRLSKSPILYEYQWTEDLFSLLVKGLPKDATKDDVINYFNMLLDEYQVSERVKDVIMLQDYKLYMQLKRKLADINKKMIKLNRRGEGKEEKKEALAQQKMNIKAQMHTLMDELVEYSHFNGRAVVIFECIQAKEVVKMHLKTPMFQKIIISCFKNHYKNYYLRGSRIEVKSAPGP